MENIQETNTQPEVKPEDILKAERSRIAEIGEIATRFGLQDAANDFVRDGKTVADFKDFVLSKQSDVRKVNQSPAVHTTKRDDTFSIGRAFAAAASDDWSQAGYEREMSQENARRSGKVWDRNSIYIDPNMTRAATVGGANAGADLVGTTFMPNRFIDQLYAKTVSDRLGVDKMIGLVGNAAIPVVTSGITPAWGTETAMASETSPGTDVKTLTPHQLTALSKFSRQLLVQGLPQIDAIVSNDIMKQIALAVDIALIAGTGASSQPTGVLATSGIGAVALGTNGDAPTYAKINDLIATVDTSNALDGSLAFATNPKATATMRTTLKDVANTNSGYIMGENSNTLVGYNTVSSTIVPSDLTKGTGTALSALVFGNWNDVALAQWGAIQLQVNPYKENAFIHYEAYSWWDVLVKRAQSFAAIKDMITTI